MPRQAVSSAHSSHAELPARFEVAAITPRDLWDALARGYEDFMAKPSHVIFLCVIYPVVGLILCRLAFGYAVLPLIYPMIAGFALLGPFAAVGLYEISRRRELGEQVEWRHALGVFRSPGSGAILALGGLLVAIFLTWLVAANAIYAMTFGAETPQSLAGFVRDLFTTPQGTLLILAGNSVGVLFAVVVLAISVVSFPLILDRHVDVGTAVSTSVRAFVKNPATMLLWGVIVGAGLAVGSLPFFFGLAVVMPILGHATWHLYRRTVKR